MSEFRVEGMEAFVRELNKMDKFPKEMKAELRRDTRKVAREAVKSIKPSIPKAKRVFNVRRTGRLGGKAVQIWTSCQVRCGAR